MSEDCLEINIKINNLEGSLQKMIDAFQQLAILLHGVGEATSAVELTPDTGPTDASPEPPVDRPLAVGPEKVKKPRHAESGMVTGIKGTDDLSRLPSVRVPAGPAPTTYVAIPSSKVPKDHLTIGDFAAQADVKYHMVMGRIKNGTLEATDVRREGAKNAAWIIHKDRLEDAKLWPRPSGMGRTRNPLGLLGING